MNLDLKLIQQFKKNVESNGGCFNLTDIEIENLIDRINRQNQYQANQGIFLERLHHNNREKAFYENWLKVNKPEKGINHGNGILQDLFIRHKGFLQKETLHQITDHERMIVATVIQWLGSNCGMSFLEETLKDFGKKIVDIEK